MNRCRKRAAVEELPLRQIFDEVCCSRRLWQPRRFCRHWKFDVQTEAYDCQVCLPIHPTPTQQSRAVDLRRWEMRCSTTVQWTLATVTQLQMIFARDGQLELLRLRHLVYVDAAFRVAPSLFYQLFTVLSSTPITHYNKLNTTCEVHHLAFHTCLFPRFPGLQFGAAFSSPALSDPAWFLTVPRFTVSHFQSPPS